MPWARSSNVWPRLSALLREDVPHHFGLGVAGANRIHVDAEGGQIDGQHLRQPQHAVLRGAIGGLPRRSDFARQRGDVHDPARSLLRHCPPHALGTDEDALQIDGQGPIPFLFAEIENRRVADDAGVIDQDVDSPGPRERFLHEPIDRLALGDVGHGAVGGKAGVAQCPWPSARPLPPGDRPRRPSRLRGPKPSRSPCRFRGPRRSPARSCLSTAWRQFLSVSFP